MYLDKLRDDNLEGVLLERVLGLAIDLLRQVGRRLLRDEIRELQIEHNRRNSASCLTTSSQKHLLVAETLARAAARA